MFSLSIGGRIAWLDEVDDWLARAQDVPQQMLDGVGHHGGRDLARRSPDDVLGAYVAHSWRGRVEPHQTQFGVENVQSHR